jgi:hypothetical protein
MERLIRCLLNEKEFALRGVLVFYRSIGMVYAQDMGLCLKDVITASGSLEASESHNRECLIRYVM